MHWFYNRYPALTYCVQPIPCSHLLCTTDTLLSPTVYNRYPALTYCVQPIPCSHLLCTTDTLLSPTTNTRLSPTTDVASSTPRASGSPSSRPVASAPVLFGSGCQTVSVRLPQPAGEHRVENTTGMPGGGGGARDGTVGMAGYPTSPSGASVRPAPGLLRLAPPACATSFRQ